ncbi:MAG TPA: fatty acid desaturase [Polyangiaceae bacterium]|jgi:fatty acid desaturase|nr:fatty acid desaturase [Polyangiaceae bacterium]
MHLQTAAAYARELKPSLPQNIHRAEHSRLLWLPIHLLVITLGITALARNWIPWSAAGLVSVLIGCSFAGLAFVAHETLHGALIHNRRAQRVVGWIAFLPFVISPRLWVAWHNRVHHGHSNDPALDPDAYPSLETYHKSATVRFVTDYLAPGRHGFGLAFSAFVGFTVHSLHVLICAGEYGVLDPGQRRKAIAETSVGVALWALVAVLIGPLAFLFGFGIPLLIGNAIVMAHILTNHTLNPQTELNDPLANSLTVTVPRWVEWLTLGFGYHVEHHLYPWMSTRHAPAVRKLLQERWPERYQSMPLTRALWQLHTTARIYKNPTTLLDVKRGTEWPTLVPGTLASVLGANAQATTLASSSAKPLFGLDGQLAAVSYWPAPQSIQSDELPKDPDLRPPA